MTVLKANIILSGNFSFDLKLFIPNFMIISTASGALVVGGVRDIYI